MDTLQNTIDFIEETYGIKAERPWATSPDNMTFKDHFNSKWFALILRVARRSLGLSDSGDIFVLNVKSTFEFISMISQVDGYMPGYHMNKQHWLTVFLDGSVPFEQITDRIEESYELVTNTPTKRIYEAVMTIPRGKVATYKKVAELAGDSKMARAVGNALHKNPDPDMIPCYRVVNSKGELSGEFAFGGEKAQQKLLEADGIEVINGRVDLSRYSI